jgi:uncharacterized membrane protein
MVRTPRRRILSVPTTPGVIGAGIFWVASLRPTLLPRDWYIQAAIGAICAAVGYGIGVLVGWLVGLVRRRPLEPARSVQWLVGSVVLIAGLLALIPWWIWQEDQRVLVDEPSVSPVTIAPMLALAIVLFAILVLFGRLVGHGLVRLDGWLGRFIPRWASFLVTAAVFVVAVVVISDDVVFRRFVDWANETYSASDATTPEGVERPDSSLVSGGPDSLAPWDTLGEYGKSFVAGATTTEELQSFAGADAEVTEPIRVFAGLKSADTAEARAALVVRELDRTGAADRDVVMAWTSTGTGWVDPVAATAAEYIYGGDTAIASMQYSYLPSWISFLVDGPKAAEAGAALNDAVHAWWSQLPSGSRPALIIFGESLGSMGTEAAFVAEDAEASVDALTSGSDGVLLVGPTAANDIWAQIEAARAPGSPVWAPVYEDGRVVRFMPAAGDVRPQAASWTGPRILYVHHPSDPVGNWTMRTMWWPPPWIDSPTGDDVPDTVGWFPFVTWLQVLADLAAGFGAEPGHGHNYDADVVDAWVTVYPPEEWTDADTERLQGLLAEEAEASS